MSVLHMVLLALAGVFLVAYIVKVLHEVSHESDEEERFARRWKKSRFDDGDRSA